VAFGIPRELPRTLTSLGPEYQRHIDADDYEIIVVDNGSAPPIELRDAPKNARLVRIDDAAASPAAAINRGLAEARGDVIAVMIDGARLASPGLLHYGRHAARLYERAIVASLGWYLGFDYERFAVAAGFDAAAEDALLDAVSWPADGYRLFEIATLDDSSVDGWFPPISESNCLFLSRATWDQLDGVDERFVTPGGGLLNLDTFSRALGLPASELVILLGEGTFHQQHGGSATGLRNEAFAGHWDTWAAEYEAIRGHAYSTPMPERAPTYLGTLPAPVLERLTRAAQHPALGRPAPLGEDFDPVRWTAQPPAPAFDAVVAALIALAHEELAARHYTGATAVARLARARDPGHPEPGRLLAMLAPWVPFGRPLEDHYAEYHLAIGRAYSIMGDTDRARIALRDALARDNDLQPAHVALSHLQLPGEHYLQWLERIYEFLTPTSVLEIGVSKGLSLATVRPPAIAIGVDPVPSAVLPLQANSHIFPETSDAFFAAGRLDGLLSGTPVGAAFIDGLHLYEQSLKDFVNVERYCGPRSAVIFHDTIPLDEPTQSRATDTQFHTGDVWKTIVCLRHYRPELDIFTIATPWTGLTVVSGFGDGDRATAFAERYDEAVARFVDAPYGPFANAMQTELNIVENDWDVVRPLLERITA
jgi:hypothetical protein